MTSRRISLFAAVTTLWPCVAGVAQFTPDRELGRYRATVDGLKEPAGVAVGADRVVRVAEADGDRISRFTLDGSSPAFDASPPLVAPHGLALGDDGLLWVADTGNHRVVALDGTGDTRHAWGGFGSGDGRFNKPEALAVAGDRVYVADTGNDRIQVFDTRGRFLAVFGTRGREPGSFMRPVGVAVDDDGHVYVADTDNQRIQKLDGEGTPLHAWGGWGSFPGLFTEPSAVVFEAGLLYVSDRLNHRVQVFDTDGSFLYQWGLHAVVPREGDGKVHYPNAMAIAPDAATLVVAEGFENRCQLFGLIGDERAAVQPPRPKRGGYSHFGPLLSVDGDLLVTSEPETRSVAVFYLGNEEPVVVTGIGTYGTRFGQMNRITGVHVDAATRRVFVADTGNDRLQVFRLAIAEGWRVRYDPALARFVHAVGLRRLGRLVEPDNPAARLEPVAMKTDADGNLFILDGHGARVVVFDPQWKLVRWWGGFGDEPGRFVNPVNLALAPGGDRVYVADSWGRRVQVFERDGSFVGSLDGDGSLVRPSDVVVAPDGALYVTDAAADRVVKLDADGRVVTAWGTPGVEHGEFWKPSGIAIDGQGRIIVHDYGNHRAQVFSPDGAWLVSFSAASSYTPRRPGRRRSQE